MRMAKKMTIGITNKNKNGTSEGLEPWFYFPMAASLVMLEFQPWALGGGEGVPLLSSLFHPVFLPSASE